MQRLTERTIATGVKTRGALVPTAGGLILGVIMLVAVPLAWPTLNASTFSGVISRQHLRSNSSESQKGVLVGVCSQRSKVGPLRSVQRGNL
jgi:hypothetical protein